MKVVLATGNPGKLRELSALLAPSGLDIVPQSDYSVPEADETGHSFVENAILKARNAASHTGLPAIADDSGIEVDALGGAPGIYSARYAGPHGDAGANNAKLLDALRHVPDDQRGARFRCVMVYLRSADDPSPIIAEGSWEGRILREPQGEHGFGYDPVFYVPSHDCSAAELDPAEKNRLSHRAQALEALRLRLESLPRAG
jgi:XTP/dITP diphosphohydrolase